MTRPAAQTDTSPPQQTEAAAPPKQSLPTKAVRWWWIVALLGSLGLLIGSALVASDHQLHGVELTFFHAINNWPDRLYYPFLAASIVSESLWIAVAVVIVTFVAKLYRLAWQVAAATVAGYGTTFIIRHFVARPRPPQLLTDVHARVHDTALGFPSGHAMISTVIVLLLWSYLPRGWRWLTLLIIPAMALSRVYLGTHAPLDVVGGFAIGLGVVAVMRLLPLRLRQSLRFD